MSEPHGLDQRRKALEESFFARRNAELLDQLRSQVAEEHKQEELAAELGMSDAELVGGLIHVGVTRESLAALSLAPLVAVAWADGKMDQAEREAILKAAGKNGISDGSASYELLDNWLETAPGDELIDHWMAFVAGLKTTLSPAEHRKLGEELIGGAREVAMSAGGFLGVGKISQAEEDVLNKLKQAFA